MAEEISGQEQDRRDGDRLSLLDFALLLARHKRLVLGFPLGVGIVTLTICFIVPQWYTGIVKILPPQQSQSNAVAILGQLGAIAGGAGQALGLKNPSDVYVSMLKSRTVADNLIRTFDLQKLYDEEFLEEARKELARNSYISAGREGVITVEVEDKDPKRAADIANGYIEELRRLTVTLAVSEAGQRRLFFESQVAKARQDLEKAEIFLKDFTKATGLVNPEGQMGLTVAAAAALRAQITAKEVQLAATRTFATESNPDVARIGQELAGLRTELARMEKNTSVGRGDVLVSVGAAPEVGLEYVRRFREVKYFETLYGVLARQYEIARIDEAKDATLIQVLDAAVPPERKTKPRRALVSLVATISAFILAVLAAFALDAINRLKVEPEGMRRLKALRDHLAFR